MIPKYVHYKFYIDFSSHFESSSNLYLFSTYCNRGVKRKFNFRKICFPHQSSQPKAFKTASNFLPLEAFYEIVLLIYENLPDILKS